MFEAVISHFTFEAKKVESGGGGGREAHRRIGVVALRIGVVALLVLKQTRVSGHEVGEKVQENKAYVGYTAAFH